MANLNKVYLIGKMGKDPQVFGQVTRLSVATTEKWKDKNQGDLKESTEWHKVVCFGHPANHAAKWGFKGADVFVEGRLKTSSYEKDGQKIYSTDIVADVVQFFVKKEQPKTDQTQQYQPTKNDSWSDGKPGTFMPGDDDIPF